MSVYSLFISFRFINKTLLRKNLHFLFGLIFSTLIYSIMNVGLFSFIGYDLTVLLNFKKYFPKSDCEDF